MEAVTIHFVNATSDLYPQIWELREAILRKPLGLSLHNEDLSRDLIDVIVAVALDGKVTGTLMLHHISEEVVQLRAMAVYDEWQGKGIGSLIVKAAEQYAVKKGYKEIMLHARKVAVGFYEVLGYSITSEEFIEVGIAHYEMRKRLI